MTHIELNSEIKTALDLMETSNDLIFLTGKAGTGKSTLLTYFRETTAKKIVVLAPTGIAALNVKGETIHSFFKFSPNITVESAFKKAKSWKSNKLFSSIDAFVIDEISMVRADLLDCIDIFLKTVMNNDLPFGGKQLVFIGDMYQLPPVVTSTEKRYFQEVYDSPYFFSAEVCKHPDFFMHTISLEKIYRQDDTAFIDILNGIRHRNVTPDQLALLNTRVHPTIHATDTGHIYLTTTNANADRVNAQKLAALYTDVFETRAQTQDGFDLKMAPTDVTLKLKIGAQVMLLNNDSYGRWVNGTIGEIVDLNEFDEEIVIRTSDGQMIVVTPHKWTVYKYAYNEKTKTLTQESAGSFRQYPLKLAWAITIHKSQGKTFESVIVDLGTGAFASGQVYVAFSRCRSLDGLILKAPLRANQIVLDTRIIKFGEKTQLGTKARVS